MGGSTGLNDKLQNTQFGVWILAAVIPAILSIIGHSSWITVLPMVLICGGISCFVLRVGEMNVPEWLLGLELPWLILLLGGLVGQSTTCWEDATADPVIPVILLLIAAWASSRGVWRAGRTGAVLIWFILPILGIVFLAGTADVQWTWERTKMTVPDGMLTALLLLPCLGLFLPRKGTAKGYTFCLAPVAVALIASVIMDGVLGGTVATKVPNTFYEFSKSVTLFGVAERFEALVACALTGGWFALFTMILSAIYHVTEKIFAASAKWSVWIGATLAVGLMYVLPKDTLWMGFGSLIFWGFLPAITQLLGGRKKIEKK